jgi:hypothetical protein
MNNLNPVDIYNLIFELNELENVTAFFEFHGHVNEIYVRVFYDAVFSPAEKASDPIYRENCYLDFDNASEKLSKIYFELNVLKEFYSKAIA